MSERSADETATDQAITGEDTTMSDTEAKEAQTPAENEATTDQSTPAEEVNFSIVFDDDDADVATDAVTAADAVSDGAGETTAEGAEETTAPEEPAANEPEETKPIAVQDTVAADNAAKVAQTLSLGGKTTQPNAADAKAAQPAKEPAALRLSERLDKELRANAADKVLMRSYPSLALNKVTLTDAKTGHNTLDRVSADCYAGHIYAFKVESDDERIALLSVMTGMLRPTDGAVMNKSLNVLEIEPGELRGHRLGIVPQRYAVRDDLNAEQNVLYAMDASGRTFLKPKPVAARELLQKVGFDSETPNAAVGKLPALQQRLVAIARAISCDAEVIIADEPTGGLDADDSVVVLKTLIGLTHGDPKRCVIVITGDDEVAEVAERVITVSE